MPTNDQIREALHTYITSQFPAARDEKLTDNDSLLTGGIVDSMGILELVTFIEGEFGITLSDDEMLADHFETIGSLTDLVAGKTQNQVATSPEA